MSQGPALHANPWPLALCAPTLQDVRTLGTRHTTQVGNKGSGAPGTNADFVTGPGNELRARQQPQRMVR